MTSPVAEIAGYVAIVAVLYILVRISDRPRKPSVAELVADARIESALLDGWDDTHMDAACDTETRNHLAPLTNTEVNRRLGDAMDTACRDFRAELDRWETA